MERIRHLPITIPSVTGKALYTDFVLKDTILHFRRVNPGTHWSVDINSLWEVYSTQDFINTTVIKKITGGRANSPSVAILLAMQCIDTNGWRLN